MTSQSPKPSYVSEQTPVMSTTVKSNGKVFVYICGQVNKPEVYELEEGARVKDAVALADGFTKQAAPECVNLARVIVDGERIYIPSQKEKNQGDFTSTEKTNVNEPEDGTQDKDSQLVNINSASLKELMNLPGIGEAKASAIIAYREEHGTFQSKEELMNITGIKTGLYTKIKDYIKVN